MRRRSFVAALPLAAAGTLTGFRAEAQGQQGWIAECGIGVGYAQVSVDGRGAI